MPEHSRLRNSPRRKHGIRGRNNIRPEYFDNVIVSAIEAGVSGGIRAVFF